MNRRDFLIAAALGTPGIYGGVAERISSLPPGLAPKPERKPFFMCLARSGRPLNIAGRGLGTRTTCIEFTNTGLDACHDLTGTVVRLTTKGKKWSPGFCYRWNGPHDGACGSGGAVIGDIADDAPWGPSYPKPNNGGHYLLYSKGDGIKNFLLEGGRVDRGWDAVRISRDWKADAPRPDGIVVRGFWITKNRDDAIEADYLQDVRVEDCLVDGTFVFLSQSNKEDYDGSAFVSAVEGCLVRLEPFNTDGVKVPGPNPGHGAFTKGAGNSPRISYFHNIFRVDQPCLIKRGDPFRLLNAKDKLAESENNIIVWGGSKKYGPYAWKVPRGFEVTEDLSVWEEARIRWIKSHPLVHRIAVDGRT
jgi:hypothetical protein